MKNFTWDLSYSVLNAAFKKEKYAGKIVIKVIFNVKHSYTRTLCIISRIISVISFNVYVLVQEITMNDLVCFAFFFLFEMVDELFVN